MLDLPLLPAPTPFTAVDCILKDAEGRLQYHYMIVEVAAAPVDPNAEVKAMDGCSDIKVGASLVVVEKGRASTLIAYRPLQA
jgi:hypothetical protein